MAELSVSGRMKVKSLKKDFKDEFGISLRVYNGKRFADDEVTLANIRREAQTSRGDLKVNGNMQIGTFETKFKEIFGITVQVADVNDSKLLDDSLTLSAAKKLN
ncbi:MAG: hypothetical protein LBS04_01315 [Tannerellaceae bacterium]|jgi:hypothetical protein|nr:hypothetical protein [Tannerellaceae bacterium]